eukprot:443917-Amphidinium_carterae.1
MERPRCGALQSSFLCRARPASQVNVCVGRIRFVVFWLDLGYGGTFSLSGWPSRVGNKGTLWCLTLQFSVQASCLTEWLSSRVGCWHTELVSAVVV